MPPDITATGDVMKGWGRGGRPLLLLLMLLSTYAAEPPPTSTSSALPPDLLSIGPQETAPQVPPISPLQPCPPSPPSPSSCTHNLGSQLGLCWLVAAVAFAALCILALGRARGMRALQREARPRGGDSKEYETDEDIFFDTPEASMEAQSCTADARPPTMMSFQPLPRRLPGGEPADPSTDLSPFGSELMKRKVQWHTYKKEQLAYSSRPAYAHQRPPACTDSPPRKVIALAQHWSRPNDGGGDDDDDKVVNNRRLRRPTMTNCKMHGNTTERITKPNWRPRLGARRTPDSPDSQTQLITLSRSGASS